MNGGSAADAQSETASPGPAETTSAGPTGTEAGHSLAASPPTEPGSSAGQLGVTLEPVLQRACDGRLSPVSWFRTDWQRGGAVTGYATYRDDADRDHDVVVKLPVPPRERQWMLDLQHADHVVPRIHAHGEALNGYDFAWLVMERLPHGPLGSAWGAAGLDLLIEAAGRFYAASRDVSARGEPHQVDWPAFADRARKAVQAGSVPDQQRWNKALKKAQRKVKAWARTWHDRPCHDWCHGDLHLGNAMTRQPAPDGPAVLFDFAHTRIGHWLEDAIYLEHLFWGRPDRLDGRRLARQLARERKARGLPIDDNWADLAQVKRALLAVTAPARLAHEGDPIHLAAALAVLEASV